MTLDRDVVRRSDEVDVVVHVAKSLRSRVTDVMLRSHSGEAVWPLRQRTERGAFTARVRFSKSVCLRAIARGDAHGAGAGVQSRDRCEGASVNVDLAVEKIPVERRQP